MERTSFKLVYILLWIIGCTVLAQNPEPSAEPPAAPTAEPAALPKCELPPEDSSLYKIGMGCLEEHNTNKLCIFQCMLVKLELLTPEGVPQRDKMADLVKSLPEGSALQMTFADGAKKCFNSQYDLDDKSCRGVIMPGLCMRKSIKKYCPEMLKHASKT